MPDIPPVCGAEPEGTQRTLSAYNLFVREMLRQFKESFPDMPQVPTVAFVVHAGLETLP
jgi:hypothetical protein